MYLGKIRLNPQGMRVARERLVEPGQLVQHGAAMVGVRRTPDCLRWRLRFRMIPVLHGVIDRAEKSSGSPQAV